MGSQSGFPLEKALLGFLIDEPTHGYALHQRAEDELGRIWYMGISNIYGTLKELEEAGQVESRLSPQESHPPRKVYRVTARGRETFLSWVRAPVPTIRDMRVEFLAKLYFFHTLGLEGVEELITAQEAVCWKRAERVKQSASPCAPHDFGRLVSDFRRGRIRASLDWLQACRDELARSNQGPAGRSA